MKTNLLITIDYKPNLGGVARYLEGYARTHNLDVLAPDISRQASIFEEDGVMRKKLIWKGWPKWLPALYWGCRFGKKYENLTISHILPIGYIGLLCKKPYTLILHGLDILNANKSKWKRYWAKKILNKANLIVVNSKATGELLRTVFGDLHSYKVEHPKIMPMPKATEDFREKYDWQNKKIIFSLGRLVKRKGQSKLIRLMPRILLDDPDVLLVIAGDGSHRPELMAITEELGLSASVIFLGRVLDVDLPNLYTACDIFVLTALPSKDNWEGFGMVCLEAAYYARPVIVTNSGGLGEAVEDGVTGFIVHTDEQLYERVMELLENKNLREELGDEGKARVEERFLIK
ncbi:glycosyltransferase family 4 protein [Patescibacteria group bacterium]|nr:glycosyltransferase family 4 protein [Patescibacteria group bacterium]